MLAHLIRRLLQSVAVMLTVALVAFVLFQYVGDPVSFILGQDATACAVCAVCGQCGSG
jgi:peptide/nickel transport system permease protein